MVRRLAVATACVALLVSASLAVPSVASAHANARTSKVKAPILSVGFAGYEVKGDRHTVNSVEFRLPSPDCPESANDSGIAPGIIARTSAGTGTGATVYDTCLNGSQTLVAVFIVAGRDENATTTMSVDDLMQVSVTTTRVHKKTMDMFMEIADLTQGWHVETSAPGIKVAETDFGDDSIEFNGVPGPPPSYGTIHFSTAFVGAKVLRRRHPKAVARIYNAAPVEVPSPVLPDPSGGSQFVIVGPN
jgi:hypothetical protein